MAVLPSRAVKTTSGSRWRPGLVLFALALGLTLLLYGPTLGLPYFWDDFPHLSFATTRTYLQIWTDVTGLPYYRPLIFSLYKLLFAALPFGAVTLPHLLVLGLHAANAVLAGQVAGRLYYPASAGPAPAGAGARQRVALGALLVFVAYPFAALPVPHLAAAMHPLVTGLILAGVWAMLKFIEQPARRWLVLAGGVALLAPYAHEAGVMAGAVIALAAVVYDRHWARRHLGLLVLLPLLSALFLPVWRAVPKSRPDGDGLLTPLTAPSLLAKLAFFAQAPTFPVQPLGTVLIERWGWWDVGAVLGLAVVALGGVVWLLWRARVWRPLALGLGWVALTMLPSVAALPFDYILISPRLLYLPGVGAALIWGAAIEAVARRFRRPITQWLAAAVAVVVVAGVPFAYVVREVRLYGFALSPLAQFTAITRAEPEARHLLVNTVNWLAYRQQWYPLGHDGVPVLAPYLDFFDLAYTNTGLRATGATATFPDLLPQLSEQYLATANEQPDELLNQAAFTALAPNFDRVWFTAYSEGAAEVQYVGRVYPAPAARPTDYQMRFGDQLYLLDSRLAVTGQQLGVTLEWAYYGPDVDATVFRNAFDCAGNVVGEGSGTPLRGMLSFTFLPPPAHVEDVRTINLDPLAADGCYQVEVGLFRADGSRVPAFGPDGSEFPNDLFVVR